MSTYIKKELIKGMKASFHTILGDCSSKIINGLADGVGSEDGFLESGVESVGQRNLVNMICLIGRMLNVHLPGPGANCVNMQFEFLAPILDGECIETTIEVINLDTEKSIATCKIECLNQGKNQVILGNAAMLLVQ